MIIAGSLKWKITIQKPTEKKDALNFVGTEWQTLYKNRRAQKIRVNALETEQRSGEVYTTVWRYRLRYLRGLTNQCRVVENGLIYEIIDHENVGGRNRETIITCKELSRSGNTGL